MIIALGVFIFLVALGDNCPEYYYIFSCSGDKVSLGAFIILVALGDHCFYILIVLGDNIPEYYFWLQIKI